MLHRMFKVDEAEANERDDLEAERDEKLVQLKERLESEVTTATDEMEKKHAYRLEQARQRLSDEHEKVCCEYIWTNFGSYFETLHDVSASDLEVLVM